MVETEADNAGAGDTAATETKVSKSIVNPKYRSKYKTPDWLGQQLLDNASVKKTVAAKPATEATEQVGKIGEQGYKPAKAAQEAQPEKVVNDGVDVNALFKIARENGINVDKFEAQRSGHGFDGRFRMTVRNMLQSVVKQRGGYVLNGEFVAAPSEFLREKCGYIEGQTPTHTQDGTKIAKPKAAAETPAAEPESKLIKAPAENTGVSPGTDEANANQATVKKENGKKKSK